MPGVTVFAPAKVNLTLEVLGHRDDSYHEIRSVVQAVRLCDRLVFNRSSGLEFTCDLPGWQPEKSLVMHAAKLIREVSGCQAGARVEITKLIPLSSGLGGDSSDSAATLLGLNELWQLGMPLGRLVDMAAGLGSDIPFFLTGGTALALGRGEIISPLPAPDRFWLVILIPGFPELPDKTATLYAHLREEEFTSGEHSEVLVTRLTQSKPIDELYLFNVFESVAYGVFDSLERFRQAFLAAGALQVHLAGAGPALFSIHTSQAEARNVSEKLQGYRVFVAETLNSGEAC